MGNKFSLLQQLSNEQPDQIDESPFPPGVTYQEYTVEVDGEESSVFIPLRECEAFEQTLSTQPKYLDGEQMREILRKHRGIKHTGT